MYAFYAETGRLRRRPTTNFDIGLGGYANRWYRKVFATESAGGVRDFRHQLRELLPPVDGMTPFVVVSREHCSYIQSGSRHTRRTKPPISRRQCSRAIDHCTGT